MNKLYILSILFVLGLSVKSFAQCDNCDVNSPVGTITVNVDDTVVAGTCVSGGDYSYYNVVAGLTYVWSTCGDTDFDTELTLYSGNGCAGTLLGYNDDYCGDQSYVSWTATFTGVVTVLLTEKTYTLLIFPNYCETNNDCMTLSVSCYDLPVGCSDADPFCTGLSYNFPMMVGTLAETGPNYACLFSQPNPVWYYLLIDNPGDVIIHMVSPSGNDIDFICWGPFTSPTGACTAGLTAACTSCPNNTTSPSFYPSGMTVDCSYDLASDETVHILGAQTGEYYLLCITNFENSPGTVSFTQTGGSGSTNCNIVFCNITNLEAFPSACDPSTNEYSVSGSVSFSSAPATGQLIVEDNAGQSQTFNAPFTSPQAYTLNGLTSDGTTHTITAYFSDAPTCELTFDYDAPAACSNCTADAGADQTLCGLSATLSGSGTGTFTTYQWSTLSTGVVFSDATAASTTVTVTTPGTYTFTLTLSDGAGSSCSDDVTIVFNPGLTVSVAPATSSICVGQSVALSATSTGSNLTYLWSNGDTNADINVAPIATTVYSVTVTDDAGCFGIASATVTVVPDPVAAFIASPSVASEDDPVITFIDQSSNAYSWSWDFGAEGMTDISSQPNPVYTFPGSGTYIVTLIVSNSAGCSDTTTGTVEVGRTFTFYMPNSFSPNGDSRNDVFTPSGTGWDLNTYSMRIYSRTGEILFVTTDANVGWDGKVGDGKIAPQGIYAVKVFLKDSNGKDHSYETSLMLMY